MNRAIAVHDRIFVREPRHFFFRNTGRVVGVRPSDGPWTSDRVEVKLDTGKVCVLEPAHVTPERPQLNKWRKQ